MKHMSLDEIKTRVRGNLKSIDLMQQHPGSYEALVKMVMMPPFYNNTTREEALHFILDMGVSARLFGGPERLCFNCPTPGTRDAYSLYVFSNENQIWVEQ